LSLDSIENTTNRYGVFKVRAEIAPPAWKDGEPPTGGGWCRSLKTQQFSSTASTYSRRAPVPDGIAAITAGAPAAV